MGIFRQKRREVEPRQVDDLLGAGAGLWRPRRPLAAFSADYARIWVSSSRFPQGSQKNASRCLMAGRSNCSVTIVSPRRRSSGTVSSALSTAMHTWRQPAGLKLSARDAGRAGGDNVENAYAAKGLSEAQAAVDFNNAAVKIVVLQDEERRLADLLRPSQSPQGDGGDDFFADLLAHPCDQPRLAIARRDAADADAGARQFLCPGHRHGGDPGLRCGVIRLSDIAGGGDAGEVDDDAARPPSTIWTAASRPQRKTPRRSTAITLSNSAVVILLTTLPSTAFTCRASLVVPALLIRPSSTAPKSF